jgi:hypothetical protein
MPQTEEYRRTAPERGRRGPAWRLTTLAMSLALIVTAVLFPFDIHPRNGVRWIEGGGLAFDGSGIALMDESLPGSAPFDEVTVALWLRLSPGARNWGSRHIVTLWDGALPPPLVLGIQSNRPFLFDRFEASSGPDYSQLHAAARLERDVPHFLVARISAERKAILLDGRLIEEHPVELLRPGRPAFSGRLVVGDSPLTRRGVEAEIHGIAVFRRALTNDEIHRHYDVTRSGGIGAIDGAEDLALLLPLDEGQGHRAADRTGHASLYIPERYSGLPEAFLHPAGAWRQLRRINVLDVAINFSLFAIFGWALASALPPVAGWRRLWLAGCVVLISGTLSFALEWAQVHSPSRVADFADVLWNTLGGAGGAALALRRTPGARGPAR